VRCPALADRAKQGVILRKEVAEWILTVNASEVASSDSSRRAVVRQLLSHPRISFDPDEYAPRCGPSQVAAPGTFHFATMVSWPLPVGEPSSPVTVWGSFHFATMVSWTLLAGERSSPMAVWSFLFRDQRILDATCPGASRPEPVPVQTRHTVPAFLISPTATQRVHTPSHRAAPLVAPNHMSRSFILVAWAILTVCLSVGSGSFSAWADDPVSAQLAITRAHWPPPRSGVVYVIAHRGVHSEGIPENTLAACRAAIELGCDFIEVDLRTTRDGQLVCVHDARLNRVAVNDRRAVRECTWAELQQVELVAKSADQAERIPRFRDVLVLCQNRCGLYLDLKDVDVVQVCEEVVAAQMLTNCVWYGRPDQLQQLRRHEPRALVMPDPGPAVLLPALLQMLPSPCVASSAKYCNTDFVRQCHRSGSLVFVDEQTPADWQPLLEQGVDGIQTDHPADLIRWLQNRSTSAGTAVSR
jgi:glycerophosphoryl diester phosphodiesterase